MDEIITQLLKLVLNWLTNQISEKTRIKNEHKKLLQQIENAIQGYGSISNITHELVNLDDEL